MSAQPQTTGLQLFDRIRSLTTADLGDDLLVRRLRKEIDDLKKADLGEAYMLLGILDCLQNNPEEMRQNHERSISLRPSHELSKSNYAASLSYCGFFDEAKQVLNDVTDSNDSTVADARISISFGACKFHESALLLDRWNELFSNQQHEGELAIRRVLSFLQDNDIADEDIAPARETVFSVLHENNIFYVNRVIRIQEDEDSRFLSYQILLNTSVEKIVELNLELAYRLAALNLSTSLTTNVVFVFVPEEE